MKRKIILFFTVLAVLCCLFALSISADEIYSDFTKEGADGKAPIFEALGYSVDPNTGSLCVEYSVDLDALDSYEAEVGKKLGFGVVVAYSGYVENGKPLDPNTAKPVGANADKVIVVNLERTAILSVRVTGLDPTQYKKELVLSLFTKTDSGVKYICDDASVEVPSTVSYHGIRGPFEVTINGITYSTDKETNPAADRVKQMNNSAAAYKSTPNANVSSAKMKARLVLIGGAAAGYDHAKEFLEYYLTGKGGTYNIDINDFLSDSGAMKSRNSAVDNALRAAESLALEGETIEIINQTEENHPM